jgi:phosphate/phosphite/phosphonate ABC transporter binding protein
MRKKLFVLMALLVVLSMLAAQCGGKATEAPPPAAEEPAPAETEEAMAEETEEAMAEEAEEPAPALEDFHAGLVTDVGKVNDGTFNQSAYEGMQRAVEEFSLHSAFIETQQPTDYEKNVQQLVDEGFEQIVTVGFMMGDTTQKKAGENPDVNFCIVDFAYDPAIPNVQGLVFREDQAGFLVGALAGLMSETKTVGIVAGIDIPPVKKYRNGYENGVKYVCPECSTIGVYLDSFTDPARGKAAAESQMAEGADVIFGAGGPTGSGGILGAAQQGVWVIGVDTDEYFTTFKSGEEAGHDKLLSSALKRVDNAVYTCFKNGAEGTFEGATVVFDAASDGVGLAPFHDTEAAVPDEVKAQVDEILGMLADGSLDTGVDPVSGDLLGEAAPAEPAPAEEEMMAGDIGTEENPIQVLFVPSVDAGVIVSGGEVMAGALEEATGLKYEVSVPTSYAATVEAMCASPEDTIGFIPALGYVLANQKCGVEVGGAAVRFGWPFYWAQYLVPRDSDIQSLEDLAGKKWAVPDLGSTSGYLFPSVAFQDAGIEPGEIVEAGGHPQAALAVYNGEVDFATTYFSPPLTDPRWQPGDDPEPYDFMEVALNEEGRTFAGDVRVLDARTAVMETAPDVFQKVRILELTDAIPNDTMSFSPEFPDELKGQITDALVEFTASEACLESICGDQFYSWTGLDPVEDSAFDPVRKLITILGYTEEDIFGG